MKKNKFFALLSLLVLGGTTSNVFGQTKTVVINQDAMIERMVEIKKKLILNVMMHNIMQYNYTMEITLLLKILLENLKKIFLILLLL